MRRNFALGLLIILVVLAILLKVFEPKPHAISACSTLPPGDSDRCREVPALEQAIASKDISRCSGASDVQHCRLAYAQSAVIQGPEECPKDLRIECVTAIALREHNPNVCAVLENQTSCLSVFS